MNLLEGYPVELLEEMLEIQREKLKNEISWENEGSIKTLMLIELIKIEISVREFEKELRGE